MFRILRVSVIALLLNGLVFGAVQAQEAEIQSTISRQIEAFQADDFETAFDYASPTLKRLFRSSENFRNMVTRGYPMVWRPAQVRYLELSEVSGVPFQKVLIKDQNGEVHILGYLMLQTEKGWKINGVQLIPTPDVAA